MLVGTAPSANANAAEPQQMLLGGPQVVASKVGLILAGEIAPELTGHGSPTWQV